MTESRVRSVHDEPLSQQDETDGTDDGVEIEREARLLRTRSTQTPRRLKMQKVRYGNKLKSPPPPAPDRVPPLHHDLGCVSLELAGCF
jgi:hypothetical protein